MVRTTTRGDVGPACGRGPDQETGRGLVALEGNLRDFSLQDVFRLLATGAKSGALHVAGSTGEGVVCFRDGEVFYASTSDERIPAAAMLSQAGIISEKQLRQAQGLMKIQKKDKAGRRLGQVLADEGYLEADVLREFVREQVSEAVFEMLRLEDGRLRFEPDEQCTEVDLGFSVPVEQIIADAATRIEAWKRIRDHVPSLDARFTMSSAPGRTPAEIHLKPAEWMMLCYLHGGRSVRELVELTGYSDFDTATVLYGMHASGLIERLEDVGEPVAE